VTVIAARVNGQCIEMSADSQFTRCGGHKNNTGLTEKIIRGSDFVIGVSGEALLLTLVSMYAKNHPVGDGGVDRVTEWGLEFLEYCRKKTDSWDQHGSLLLAHKSGLYAVYDWIPLVVTDFWAIGSGLQYAETAMYLGHSTEEAVLVAIQMAYGCGGNVVTEQIELGHA